MSLQYESKLSYSDNIPLGDSYEQKSATESEIFPDPGHIISKDKEGNPVSRYRDDIWDLSMYRTSLINSTGKITLNRFNWPQKRIDELKRQLFILMYFMDRGRIGQITIGSLANFKTVIEKIINFAINEGISYKEFWENEDNIKKFLIENLNLFTLSKLLALHSNLIAIDKKQTGINVFDGELVKQMKAQKHKFAANERQTPLIPSRIYAIIIKQLNENVDNFYAIITQICTLFRRAATIPYYAQQPCKNENFKEASENLGLSDYFQRHNINHLRDATAHLSAIRVDCAFFIAAYTGMRIGEILALTYNCLEQKQDNQGRLVNLIGSTFKLYGVAKKTSWLAPSEIKKPIHILEEIAQTIWENNENQGKPKYLFISITPIGPTSKASNERLKNPVGLDYKKSLTISPIVKSEDIQELTENNPYLDYEYDGFITVGEPWPLAAHQFRRSLAVYASQSGLVSLPTLKMQFKHLTKEMTMYYAKGASYNNHLFAAAENKNHFAHEYLKAKPATDALAYIKNVLLADKELYGAHGAWVEQRKKGSEAHIIDRKDIVKRFQNGEMAYNETPLGACLTVEPCDKKLFGMVSACVSCSSAVIDPDKLNNVIAIQGNATQNSNLTGFEKKLELEYLDELKMAQESINKSGS